MYKTLLATACVAAALTFGGAANATVIKSNMDGITIPDSGNASPFPSTINIGPVTGSVTEVTVTLIGLTHSFPDDLDVLLVGPGGDSVALLNAQGGGTDVTNIDVTFKDIDGFSYVPDGGPLVAGEYDPVTLNLGLLGFTLAGPTGYSMSIFDGVDPEGTWSLYINDRESGDSGSLEGWQVTLEGVNEVPEPASLGIFGIGLAGLALLRRKRVA